MCVLCWYECEVYTPRTTHAEARGDIYHPLPYCRETRSLTEPEAGWPESSQNSSGSVSLRGGGSQACTAAPHYMLLGIRTQVLMLAEKALHYECLSPAPSIFDALMGAILCRYVGGPQLTPRDSSLGLRPSLVTSSLEQRLSDSYAHALAKSCPTVCSFAQDGVVVGVRL